MISDCSGWHGKFRGHGCRFTLPREAVLNFLSKTDKHPSVDEVFSAVNKLHPGIGIATIYRTLDLLSQIGLVVKFEFGDGKSRYELAESKRGHHQHLVCTECGKIIDYSNFVEKEAEFFKRLEKELAKRYNFRISSHQIHFYGLCKECS